MFVSMENLCSPKNLSKIMREYDVDFNKKFGQNFLIDSNIIEKIVNVAEIDNNTAVLEIGPGVGTLTQRLAQRANKLYAAEIEYKLNPILNDTLSGFNNVKVLNQDILKISIKNLFETEFPDMDVKVVANLPYYITTPIIMGLLEEQLNLKSIVIMIQKEVALRIVAKPGTKEYGALSVAVQYFTEPEIAFNVSANCFTPQPKVDSVVIKLNPLKSPSVNVKDNHTFFNIVKAAFGQRRKTLPNALYNSGYFNLSKDEIISIIKKNNISEAQRGETLSIQQFAKLSDAF